MTLKYELMIQHGNTILIPEVIDGVTVEWDRKGQPGKLSFDVVKDEKNVFTEGDACRLSVNGTRLFYGFIFDIQRSGSSAKEKITVYDQLYYLKNKDYFQYENKTASEVVRMLAEDFGLNVGSLDDTKHRISRTEDNKTLFDIIQTAIDETVRITSQLYVLYDNAGKLMLTNINNMRLGVMIDDETAADYEYKSSISNDTYNKVRLFREGSSPVIVKSADTIKQWGVLQYVKKVTDDDTNLENMAQSMLNLYNQKTKILSINKVLGDIRVRAGTMLVVVLDLGDTKLSNFMIVEQVKHTFKESVHLMDLKLRGDGFVT